MKGQTQINKKDLYDMISFALKEYGSMTLLKSELMSVGFITKAFGTISAKISMVTAEKNRLYLRRYDVFDYDGSLIISYILGHAKMLFGVSSRKFREKLLVEEKVKGVVMPDRIDYLMECLIS